jgi:hypothetical protein
VIGGSIGNTVGCATANSFYQYNQDATTNTEEHLFITESMIIVFTKERLFVPFKIYMYSV